MNKKLIAEIFIIVLILSACQIQNDTSAVVPSRPTMTPSSVSATSTRPPTKTSTAIPPTATADIQATQTQQADDLLQAEMDAFPTSCDYAWRQILSPDHTNIARICSYDNKEKNQTLEIVTKSGIKWEVKFNDYLTDEFKNAFHEFMGEDQPITGELDPIEWSKDGDYLYFGSTVFYIGADGPNYYGREYNGLYRIEVETGNISTILSPSSSINGYRSAFSPNGRWLAYGKDQPFILDIKTGQNIPLDEEGLSYNFSWSPDNSKISFVFRETTIEVFSIETKTNKKIQFEDGTELNIFPSEEYLGVQIMNNYSGEFDQFFQYDWSSEELKQITLTPTPMQ